MTHRMILISTNHPSLRFPSKEVFRTINLVYHGEALEPPALSVVFTNNHYIKKINSAFLGHKYVTDVIAFALGEDGGVEAEIYINLDAACKQAKEFNVTFKKETQRLLIHGVLHLLGYLDKKAKDKEKMVMLEDKYLEKLCQRVRN